MVIGRCSSRIYERDQVIGVGSESFRRIFNSDSVPQGANRLPSEGLNFYTTAQQHRQHRGRASHQDIIFECRAFGIVRLEPLVRGDRIGKHLEMIGVASIRAAMVARCAEHAWLFV
jgi:hypothetical protein